MTMLVDSLMRISVRTRREDFKKLHFDGTNYRRQRHFLRLLLVFFFLSMDQLSVIMGYTTTGTRGRLFRTTPALDRRTWIWTSQTSSRHVTIERFATEQSSFTSTSSNDYSSDNREQTDLHKRNEHQSTNKIRSFNSNSTVTLSEDFFFADFTPKLPSPMSFSIKPVDHSQDEVGRIDEKKPIKGSKDHTFIQDVEMIRIGNVNGVNQSYIEVLGDVVENEIRRTSSQDDISMNGDVLLDQSIEIIDGHPNLAEPTIGENDLSTLSTDFYSDTANTTKTISASRSYNFTIDEIPNKVVFDDTGEHSSSPLSRISRIFGPLKRFVTFLPRQNHTNIKGVEETLGNSTDATPVSEEKPTLRRLWRRRHARTLEEGIRRERTNALSMLMNRAQIDASQAQERTYVERSLMGLINALAEETEDLDIDVKTVPNTPVWRKEVDELRINFSRLGFRPIRMGGTNSITPPHGVEALAQLEDITPEQPNSTELSFVESADEGFNRIDEDNSGTLDRDEIAQALSSISALDTNPESIEELASELIVLYDVNGDGVVDREEYQQMVEDMAKLRSASRAKPQLNDKSPFDVVRNSIQTVSQEISKKAAEVASAARDTLLSDDTDIPVDETEMGSIVFSKLNLDLRRLVFGAFPVVKKVSPGGPLILEPFTATVTASFSRDDVMGSFLLDAGLRRLVARALRVRVRSFRDLVDGALFVGRRWKMTSKSAPVVEVLGLSNVEFDSRDRMIITGRARIRTSPDAPTVTNTFKVRTKIGTRKNGHVIRLVEPELAFVFECPEALDNGLRLVYEAMGLSPPKRPEPYYSFFPIYSPFKVSDNDGFDMGEDNCIRSIFIRDGKLRFEMSAVLRPGRFLGNHYVAFTLPMRTFIITMDRVWEGIRAARENKRIAARAKKLQEQEAAANDYANAASAILQTVKKNDVKATKALKVSAFSAQDGSNAVRTSFKTPASTAAATSPHGRLFQTLKNNKPKPKSFFARFVEGYTMIEREGEANNERLTNDISDWFGRQGQNNSEISTTSPSLPTATNDASLADD